MASARLANMAGRLCSKESDDSDLLSTSGPLAEPGTCFRALVPFFILNDTVADRQCPSVRDQNPDICARCEDQPVNRCKCDVVSSDTALSGRRDTACAPAGLPLRCVASLLQVWRHAVHAAAPRVEWWPRCAASQGAAAAQRGVLRAGWPPLRRCACDRAWRLPPRASRVCLACQQDPAGLRAVTHGQSLATNTDHRSPRHTWRRPSASPPMRHRHPFPLRALRGCIGVSICSICAGWRASWRCAARARWRAR